MAARAPASTLLEQQRVGSQSNINFTRGPMLDLGMTLEAKIGVAFDQQLAVDRAVGLVTNSAAFAQGFVFENERTALLAMTLGTLLVEPCHSQAAGGFQNIGPMRIVALNAIHPALEHRVMLGQAELGMSLQMALEASFRVFAGINDELAPPTTGLNVFTAWAMAGFAPALAGHGRVGHMETCMRAGGEHAGDVGMAIVTGLIAHINRT